MRRAIAAVALAASLVGAHEASADEKPALQPAPAPAARVLTDLSDGRACAPLASGEVAFGTGGGLVLVGRDRSARTMTALDGLPETRVHALAEQGGALWVGTEAGAAAVTTAGAPRVVRTLPGAPVHAVYASPSGQVYLGAWGVGVLRVPSAEGRAERVPSRVASTRVAAIAEHGGALFVAHADGPLTRLEDGALRSIPGSPTHGQALASVAGPDGAARLVLGDLEGLYRVDAGAFTSIASVDARALAQADGGALLAGTYGAGVMTGSTRGALRSVHGAGRLVAGVGARGRVRCSASARGLFVDWGEGRFERVDAPGLPSNDVTAVAPNGDRVAVGAFDAGAVVWEKGAAKRVAGLEPNESVSAIAWQGEGPSARLVIGTAHGLIRVEPDGSMRRLRAADGLPHSYVRAVRVLSAERVLVATDGGPAIVERDRVTPLGPVEKGTPTPLASPMHASWALAAAPDGTLFVGTTSGLYWGKDGRYERASLATGELGDDWVTAIALDGDDVYVGTYAHGVARLRFPAGRRDVRPAAAQLGGGYVNPDGVVLAGGRVFAATMDGLLERAKSDEAASWTTRRDAALGRDVTALRFVGGDAWIASRRGVVVRAL